MTRKRRSDTERRAVLPAEIHKFRLAQWRAPSPGGKVSRWIWKLILLVVVIVLLAWLIRLVYHVGEAINRLYALLKQDQR